MNAADKKEMRQMIEDLIAPLSKEVLYQGRLTNISLNNIDSHLTKLNGSVARHEKAIVENLPHTIANCPQGETIKELRDTMVTTKAIRTASRNNLLLGVSVASGLWVIYQLVKSLIL